ncbi:hypothetical protein L1987_57317 [Smallanthus sonchifolius]|uniref:Uncharacterized protein n=1 Tax=Smallanthus sonchifolius TaxID=185202 RepID=A0ACB9DCG2_9ASTR|nr:hypothetical protein L1987_57317 [Smallanthus sonchifolius]
MASEMICELPNVSLTDDFEELLENMELDEGLLNELLEIMNDDDMVQTSMMDAVAMDVVVPLNEKNGDSSYSFLDHESQLLFHHDTQIQDLDYWVSESIVEMASTFPGLTFENEMMPFWHVENPVEVNMIDDIAYFELWEK